MNPNQIIRAKMSKMDIVRPLSFQLAQLKSSLVLCDLAVTPLPYC